YAPRAGMNKFFELAHTPYHDWTVDGGPTAGDVYIDAQRVGLTPQGVATSGSTANVTGTLPKWRSIIVGVEREGGCLPRWPIPPPTRRSSSPARAATAVPSSRWTSPIRT